MRNDSHPLRFATVERWAGRLAGRVGHPNGREAVNWRATGIVIALVALTGCATTRYVPTYCLTHDQQLPEAPPKIHDKLTGQADIDVGIIAGSAIRLRAYGDGLRTILEGCRDPGK